MLLGDNEAATSTIQAYFNGPFKSQIASNGEQPFEANRTDAYHYRCFNLEAMIVSSGNSGRLSYYVPHLSL
jgi:hypothetical protein